MFQGKTLLSILAIIVLISALGLISCNSSVNNKQEVQHKADSVDTKNNASLAQLELPDSSRLIHIKNQFYKSENGQVFERTFANREINDSLVSVEYFNGVLPQGIDPLTFESLDGWFAKDTKSAYYYRPTSGGMSMIKLQKADSKTFKVLTGHYLYAIDKKHVFKELDIIDGLSPTKLKIIKDSKGKILKLISGDVTHITE